MNAGWAAVIVSATGMAGLGAGVLVRGGRRDGKIDTILEQLTKISQDHEARLRIVEQIRAPQRRSR